MISNNWSKGFTALLCALLLGVSLKISTAGDRPVKGLIEVHDEANAIPLAHAVDRLRAYSPVSLDMINGLESHIPREPYAFTVLLGVTGTDPELQKAWSGGQPADEDAWSLKTISTSPLVIAATGNRPRSVLYAAYRLADILKLGSDLSSLDESHSPLVPQRQAAVCATSFGGPGRRHSEYMATLDELPRYGINGLFVVPGQWRVALGPGRVNPPIVIEQNGDVQADEKTRLDWLMFLGAIKSYDMNITLTVEPFAVPAYTEDQVKGFYATGNFPPDYLADLGSFYGKVINRLFDTMPFLDAVCITPGVEGAQYGGGNAHAVRLFLYGQNIDACTKVMKVYLDTATRIASSRGKKVLLWTHQWGSTTDTQLAMWNLAASYPDVVPLGEDYWPNELWPNGGTRLPVRAYLPSDFRAKLAGTQSPFGILSINDAEYYGGGSMPDAFADPYVFTAHELVHDKVPWAIFRLNQHDRTPFGTLWTVPEILTLQENNALWSNSRTPGQVWDEWIERRYGKAAAPFVSPALASSGLIIKDGFSVNGLNLFEHSVLSPLRWSTKGVIYRLFGAPEQALFNPNLKSITSPEQLTTQLQLHSVRVEEFRRNQSIAMQAATDALGSLEKGQGQLSLPDYAYLRGIFLNAQSAIRIFSALGEMAYYANLTENNYAKTENPQGQFEKSAAAVEALAADPSIRTMDYANSADHDIQKDMLKIVQEYRDHVNQVSPKTTAALTGQTSP